MHQHLYKYFELLARNDELVHHETMRSSALSHIYFVDGKLKNHVSVSLTSGASHALSLLARCTQW